MSYILDALRKSDRERRIGEPAPLEVSVITESPAQRRHRWAAWLVVALIAINVATVSYLVLERDPGTPPPSAEAPTETTEEAPAASVPRPRPVAPGPAAADEEIPNSSSRTSISDMLAQTKQPAPQQRKPSPASPVPVKKPAERPASTARRTAPATPRQVTTPVLEHKANPAEQPPIVETKTARPSKSGAAGSIPYLDDLPRDIQRRVPSLKINVYVFSENPDERFIVANMAKYRPGQQIAEGLTLEDIEATNMILRFEGRKFRIRRP